MTADTKDQIARRVALQNRPLPAYNYVPAGEIIPPGGPDGWPFPMFRPTVPSPLYGLRRLPKRFRRMLSLAEFSRLVEDER